MIDGNMAGQPWVRLQRDGRNFVLYGADTDEYIFSRVAEGANFYEALLLDAVAAGVPAGSTVVDIGANIGNHTLFFAGLLDVDVIAVEPEPRNAALLRLNVAANKLTDRVVVHEAALGESAGFISLQQAIPGNSGSWHTVEQPEGPGRIGRVTLDSLLTGLKKVALIKVDVEGDEARVLRGGLKAIAAHKPIICVETHGAGNYRAAAQLLEPLGYVLAGVEGLSDNAIFVHCTVPSDFSGRFAAGLQVRASRHRHREVMRQLTTLREAIAPAIEQAVTQRLDSPDKAAGSQEKSLSSQLSTFLDQTQAAETRAWRSYEGLASLNEAVRSQEASLAGALAALLDQSKVAEAAAGRRTSRETQLLRENRELRRRVSDLLENAVRREEERAHAETSRARAEAEAAAEARAREVWREAYQVLSQSRALTLAHRFRSGAARIGLGRDGHRSPEERYAALEVKAAKAGRAKKPPFDLRVRTVHLAPTAAHPGHDTVRVAMAAIPSRIEGLKRVIDRLLPQVDEFHVWLNGFEEVPTALVGDRRLKVFFGEDLGDRGKFRFVDGYEGYYLSVDDDIGYPSFYVEHMIDGIERYGRRAAVGWHGSILKPGFKDYYDPSSRQVLSFRTERAADTQVHLLGTGCAGFHSDTLKLRFADFKLPNMADIFFALTAQRQQVPLVVLAHRKGWAVPVDLPAEQSISGASMKQATGRLNVRAETNRRVSSFPGWSMSALTRLVPPRELSVALLGRVNPARWKKGGILKSAHLTREMMAPLGVDLRLYDLETDDCNTLRGHDPRVVMVYPGDPQRPDFANVEQLVEEHLERGRVVTVNLSLNLRGERTSFIVDRIGSWAEQHGGRVRLMVFSEMARQLPGLAPIKDNISVVPKTISVPRGPRASYHESEGVFIGDVGKLSDDLLFDEPVDVWIDMIRKALPGVPLFAVRQYKPKVQRDLGVTELPFLRRDYATRLSAMRLMVSPFRHCTFEMVPMEVAGLGVPVVYRAMEQSLSEYLGMGGVEIKRPEDLLEVLPILYDDPVLWRQQSRAGSARAESWSTDRQAAQMYMRLKSMSALAD